MSLDPPLDEMRRLGHLAVDRAVDHLAHLRRAPVARRWQAAELAAVVHEPLPRTGRGLDDCIATYCDHILPHATLVQHPRFFAYVPGPGSFAGALGEWLAAATNTFVGTWLGGAVMAQLEIEVLDWLRQMLGLAEGTSGILTTGGSMANLGALAAARARAAHARSAPGAAGTVGTAGTTGATRAAGTAGTAGGAADPGKAVVYVGSEAHYSMAKAARVLGFAAEHVRVLAAADGGERLDPRGVREAMHADRAAGLEPLLVCATAGTTNTGAVDPLTELADLASAEGVWLHVDAAYGGAAALVPELRPLLTGLERADSVTIDPHKWLYCPVECGALLTRHVAELRRAFTADGTYMQDIPREEVNFFERGPELSRGNRALKLWFVLRGLGVDAIANAVREDVRLCRLACELMRADARVEIVTEPVLGVFTFRLRTGERATAACMERVLADGFLMLSSSRVRGGYVLRWCVANHRTTEADVRESVQRVSMLIP